MSKYTLNTLSELTTKWAEQRGILSNGNIYTQTLKLTEEVGEIADALIKNKRFELLDSIGDCLVVLNSLAILANSNIEECWNLAYKQIQNRTGSILKNGNFLKDE